MAAEKSPMRTVWVRRNDELHELPIACPDSWPYSTAAAHRSMAGRKPEDDGPPMVLTSVLTEESVTVFGSGTSEDPLHCPELEGTALSPCTCEISDLPAQAESPLDIGGTVDGAGIPPEQDTLAAPDQAQAPRHRLSTMRTVFLPGDEPGRQS